MQFEDYIARWQLEQDGEPIITHSSRLLPVRQHGRPAMLKIAHEPDEMAGNAIMVWWNGEGAAPVLEHDEAALLIERAQGTRSLAAMARNGEDEEATRILCAATARLHAIRRQPLPVLKPLKAWFRDLELHAHKYGGIFSDAAATAQTLLDAQQEITVLHGDVHHDNFLDFGERGWLAVDPKWIIGDRAFDYANIFCNPDSDAATPPHRFLRRLEVIGKVSGLERRRLLQWTLAWAGLSAIWFLEDNQTAAIDLAIAELVQAELSK
ncbi:APH(6) family putative aminoglycoside O-phosphotransferase [Chitinophaga alhagiae]|uniref:APH(6) family putative aminoglycoside O-phosphotransferase n=1 Tax=Chitinophaga alhagiae TaxID=2203219 RepID=A0ABN5LVZ0_9BACT|nr:aminoglycoside phosphotransferase family protein [Chitinophaga alhagiae]AWO00312.1 APH(6) family putative aminoglycoside O-phosphotransferase [Chitinophaga alhagiae]